MGYRIIYGGGFDERTQRQRSTLRRCLMTVFFAVIFLLTVSAFWPEGKALLRDALLPGDPNTTLEAAELFVKDISSGKSFRNAVTAFCHTVLHDGQAH